MALLAWLGGADPVAAQGAADTLTVEECIALARGRAPDVLASGASLAAARADSVAVGYNRWPAFSLFGGATVAPRGFYDPTVTDLGGYQAKVGMELPLLDGGSRTRERRRASLDAAAATAEASGAARDAGLRTAAVALDVLRQRELEEYQFDALAWLERLASLAESGVRSGAHGRADALRAGLERSSVATELSRTRQEHAALDRELAELLGRTDATPVEVREIPASMDFVPTTDDSLHLLARAATLPALRQAEVEEARERVAVQEARRKNALQIGLAADAGLAGADLTSPVPQDLKDSNPDATFADRLRRDLGASASVQFKRPLADPSVRHSVAAREHALQAAALRRQTLAARARREALDLLGRWRAAAVRLAIARDAASRADENLLRMRSLYSGGRAGLFELLDARRQLDDARTLLTEARFEARQAHYEAEAP